MTAPERGTVMQNRALRYRAFGPPLDHLRLEPGLVRGPTEGRLRVAMLLAPVNPSDLIPVTGAYAHRTTLPAVAGYEGVGRVIDAPAHRRDWIGRRVLPLRGDGTWQDVVDCDPDLAVPVPDTIDDPIAARAYINPLTAWEMLERWPVAGKRVLLSGAGSHCADLIGHWALRRGAACVVGLYRSPRRAARLRSLGIVPVSQSNANEVASQARAADLAFDSLGGRIGTAVLGAMRHGTRFVGYGLLTGAAIRPSEPPAASFERFHLRDALARMSCETWQARFRRIWPALESFDLPEPRFHALDDWRSAVVATTQPGGSKPLLVFDRQCESPTV